MSVYSTFVMWSRSRCGFLETSETGPTFTTTFEDADIYDDFQDCLELKESPKAIKLKYEILEIVQ